MADFLEAYKRTNRNEGGYCLVDGDSGGETYGGISRRHHPTWDGWAIVDKHKPLKHNQHIEDDNLEDKKRHFYKQKFWDKVSGDDIKDQVTAERLYDFAVNAGTGMSIKQIQETLGLATTGKLDNQLIDAINNPAKNLI